MPAGPNHPVQMSQAQIHHQQQQHQALANEMAKRRSRKPTDRTLPDGVDDIVIGPEAAQRYKDLRDLERRLDAAMTRKRLDLIDSPSRGSKVMPIRDGYTVAKDTLAQSLIWQHEAVQDTSHLHQQHRRGPSLAGQ